MAYNDKMFQRLLADPNFSGPVVKTKDIKNKTDKDFFRPKGDPFRYKFIDDYNLGFERLADGQQGVVSIEDIMTNNPTFLDQPEVRANAPIGSIISNFGSDFRDEGRQALASGAQQTRVTQSGGSVASAVSRPDAPPIQTLPSLTPQTGTLTKLPLPGADDLRPAPPTPEAQGSSAYASIDKFVRNPEFGQALAALGAAIGGDTPGGQMAQAAVGILDKKANSRFLGRILAGEDIASVNADIGGSVSMETKQQALRIAGRTPEQELALKSSKRADRTQTRLDERFEFDKTVEERLSEAHEFNLKKVRQQLQEGDIDIATAQLRNEAATKALTSASADPTEIFKAGVSALGIDVGEDIDLTGLTPSDALDLVGDAALLQRNRDNISGRNPTPSELSSDEKETQLGILIRILARKRAQFSQAEGSGLQAELSDDAQQLETRIMALGGDPADADLISVNFGSTEATKEQMIDFIMSKSDMEPKDFVGTSDGVIKNTYNELKKK